MNRRNDDLHAAVAQICACRDLAPLIACTRTWARRLTGADGVTFILRSGEMCHYADEDAIAPLWKGQRFPLGSCISGWVMRHREAISIPDIYLDSRVPHDLYRPTFVKSLLMVPVRKTDPIGAIGAYWQTISMPTPRAMQVVELLGEAAALGLASDQMWPRVRDALSGGV